jgi:hypothetical protein
MKSVVLIIIFIILLILVEWYNKEDSRVIGRLSHDAELIVPGITKRCTILSGDSTYTENKNKIYILIRDPSGRYYNFDTLMYALLHEIAHVIVPEIGHTQMFMEVFRNLLTRANEIGIYEPSRVDMTYCRQCIV